MDYPASFLRQVKKIIKARPQLFFATTRPGFETECKKEIIEILNIDGANCKIETGGVEFSCPIEGMWLLHLKAQTINSIKMRLTTFRAGELGELLSKTKKIPLHIYLPTNPNIDLQISLTNCRIPDSQTIKQSLIKTIATTHYNYIKNNLNIDPTKEPPHQATLYLLGKDNHYTLSIDCSGKKFYQRGYKPFVKKAILRETSAASILLASNLKNATRLFDPMCGSGTFALEAISHILSTSSHFMINKNGVFPFFNWPSFRPSSFSHICNNPQKCFSPSEVGLKEIYSSDISDYAISTINKNREVFLQVVRGQNLATEFEKIKWKITKQDIFDTSYWKKMKLDNSDLVVLNPPYGKQIKCDSHFFYRLEKLIREILSYAMVAIIAPSVEAYKILTSNMKAKKIEFFNGGIKCNLLIFTPSVADSKIV